VHIPRLCGIQGSQKKQTVACNVGHSLNAFLSFDVDVCCPLLCICWIHLMPTAAKPTTTIVFIVLN